MGGVWGEVCIAGKRFHRRRSRGNGFNEAVKKNVHFPWATGMGLPGTGTETKHIKVENSVTFHRKGRSFHQLCTKERVVWQSLAISRLKTVGGFAEA